MPFLMISKSGGARMQEAPLSLMQMVKTSAKLALLAAQKAIPQTGRAAKKVSSKKKKSLLEPSQGDEQLNLTLKG
mgnify:CR=1 FL=1